MTDRTAFAEKPEPIRVMIAGSLRLADAAANVDYGMTRFDRTPRWRTADGDVVRYVSREHGLRGIGPNVIIYRGPQFWISEAWHLAKYLVEKDGRASWAAPPEGIDL